MKKILLALSVFSISIAFVKAQKIGVIDTNYILAKLPQYKDAENRLNSQISQWQGDLQRLQSEYENRKAAFDSEKILLVGDQLKLREKEVTDLETNIRNTINGRFGTNGEIDQLRASLTKPFQDQIWTSIKTISEKNNLGIVLDKSNGASVLFLDKKYDYTDNVLDLLGKNLSKVNTTSQQDTKVGAPVNDGKKNKINAVKQNDSKSSMQRSSK
ncbi:OmpH family outer membrane protein [Chryseobacterium sp. T1]